MFIHTHTQTPSQHVRKRNDNMYSCYTNSSISCKTQESPCFLFSGLKLILHDGLSSPPSTHHSPIHPSSGPHMPLPFNLRHLIISARQTQLSCVCSDAGENSRSVGTVQMPAPCSPHSICALSLSAVASVILEAPKKRIMTFVSFGFCCLQRIPGRSSQSRTALVRKQMNQRFILMRWMTRVNKSVYGFKPFVCHRPPSVSGSVSRITVF